MPRSGIPPAVSPAVSPAVLPAAVLFDRDGTLVVNVPYNGNPELVRPMPGARAALDRLRVAGVALAVVTNQSGIAKGLFTRVDAERVNRRIEELLGPIPVWEVCPHDVTDGCDCRKPRPGMLVSAALRLGVGPSRCVVVGDIGRDVEAATAIGAGSILIPTAATPPAEIAAAPCVAADLAAAVDLLLPPTSGAAA